MSHCFHCNIIFIASFQNKVFSVTHLFYITVLFILFTVLSYPSHLRLAVLKPMALVYCFNQQASKRCCHLSGLLDIDKDKQLTIPVHQALPAGRLWDERGLDAGWTGAGRWLDVQWTSCGRPAHVQPTSRPRHSLLDFQWTLLYIVNPLCSESHCFKCVTL